MEVTIVINFILHTIVSVSICCQLVYLHIFGMCSQCISKHFTLDSDIWYFNQEIKMISISMVIIIPFGLHNLIYVLILIFIMLVVISYVYIQYANIVFFHSITIIVTSYSFNTFTITNYRALQVMTQRIKYSQVVVLNTEIQPNSIRDYRLRYSINAINKSILQLFNNTDFLYILKQYQMYEARVALNCELKVYLWIVETCVLYCFYCGIHKVQYFIMVACVDVVRFRNF